MKIKKALCKMIAFALLVALLGSGMSLVQTQPVYAQLGQGLLGEYYDNMDFTNLKLSRSDTTVQFDWGTGSPASSIGDDSFSIRWTGQVRPLYTEKYDFYVAFDGAIRLWVNGELLIDKWFVQSDAEWKSSLNLKANTDYDVRLEYYSDTGNASVSLAWSSSRQVKQIIPQSRLDNEAPLVSSGKTATAQDFTTGFPPVNAIDGDTTTYWSGGAYPRWWQIDLGEQYDIRKIDIRNYVDGTRYYKYNIQTSSNGTNWTTVASKTDSNPATEEGDTYQISGLGRYVRVNITFNSANTGTHISDFKVYGYKECTIDPVLLTSGKTAEIEAEYFYSYEPIVRYEGVGHEAWYAIDGSTSTYATITPYQHFWEVDLEDNYDIHQVNIRNYVSGDRYYQYVIYISRQVQLDSDC